MSLPDYQTAMLPLLSYAAQAPEPISIMHALPALAQTFNLTEEELAERLPSGVQGVFHNRLHWAKFYMTRAGLLESTRRGRFQITAAGRALLASNPARIDNTVLARYPQFADFVEARRSQVGEEAAEIEAALPPTSTPDVLIDAARRELDANLKAEILDRVRRMSPAAFEHLVITLLLAMGYGQGREELGRVLGGRGDGGVDGVINQDALGLDRVYIQAKRYKEGATIGPAEINSFIGALNIKRANKGLFVTASSYTKQAREHATSSTVHVVLLDGEGLADLMVRHNVGVVRRYVVEVKDVDEGFFEDL